MTLESKVEVKYTLNQFFGMQRDSSYDVLMEGVDILHNDCVWCVDYNDMLRSPIQPWNQRSR